MRRAQAVVLFFALAVFFVSSWGFAQKSFVQPDETLPGFRPQNLLEAHGLDNISIFGGDLGIVVPLGPSYTLSSVSSWQLRAFYSAKLWRMDAGLCVNEPTTHHAYLRGDPTIGVGWTLSLGYVGPSSVGEEIHVGYFGPDGGFHEGGQDGSHIRIAPQGNPITSYTVEFPDGTRHTFSHPFSAPNPTPPPPLNTPGDFTELNWEAIVLGPAATRFGLTQIEDSFRNVVLTVSYDQTSPWEVTAISLPTLGQTINLQWAASTSGGATWQVVNSIDFPIFGSTPRQQVTFAYQAATFFRNNYDNSSRFGANCPKPSAPSVAVPSLASITFSDASASFSYSYGMTYFASPSGDPIPAQQQGALQTMTLPTGGNISYTYSSTAGFCQVPGCSPDAPVSSSSPTLMAGSKSGEAQSFLDKSIAVASRCESTSAAPCPAAATTTTSYARQQFVVQCLPQCYDGYDWDPFRVVRRVDVVAPGNDAGGPSQYLTRYYFHVASFADSAYRDGGIELERRHYADATTATVVRDIISCWPVGGSGGGCGYHTSAGTADLFTSSFTDLPPKQAEVAWYGAAPSSSDGGSCNASFTTKCSTWVGSNLEPTAEKYKDITIASTLTAMPGWTSRVTTTNWTPTSSPEWNLDLYSFRRATDNGTGLPSPASVTTDYSFDQTNGFLNSFSTNDATYGSLTHAFTPDLVWNTRTEAVSGAGQVDATVFTNTRTFVSGSTQWFMPLAVQRTGIPWKSFDVDRDTSSGLITKSRDPNPSLETSYTYDALGRLKSIVPPGAEAPTAIVYDTATQTTVSRNGSDGNATWQRYLYDGLGRLIREIRQMPVGSATNYALRVHGYDAAGHANVVSEWGGCGPAVTDCSAAMQPLGTISSNFDPFGRPQAITRADGTVTTIDRTDGPIQFSDSLESVTVTINGASTTATRKDALGRAITVTEPSVGQGTEDTNYTYNVLDKLAGVTQGSQTRTFVYDAFGFLRSETTPEKGTVTYSAYDALGGVGTEIQTEGTQIVRLYDLAGRLQKTTAGGSVFLRNCYDGLATPCVDNVATSSGGSYFNAKLVRRYGYNPTSAPALTVTDDFIYNNAAGRLSSQTTSFDSGSLTSAAQSWSYNSLGLLAQHAHYRSSGAPFALTTSYSQGMPTTLYSNGIPTATAVTYSPSGALSGYTTGLGIGPSVITTLTPDPSGIPRPLEIKAQPAGSGVLFDTGNYVYDGAGNVTAMGLDAFGYDPRSRLCTTALSGIGSQYYTYDRYGNLITKGSSPPANCWSSTAWSNNRVPTGTYGGNPGLRGDLTAYGGVTYSYDSLDRLTATSGWSYFFDGASERTARVPPTGDWTYTLRDEGKRLSTEFAGATPAPSRDNVFLGSLLVASYANASVQSNGPIWAFYSSDHLGTPRLITDVAGNQSETRHNWPYGEDIGTPSASERVRFASMERDTESTTYHDHARHHEFTLGRFLSPDKLQGRISNPQSWNRYAYALNNPLKFLDPDGQAAVGFIGLGNSPGGITKIVSQINGAPGVGQAISIGSPLGPTRKDIARAVSFLASRHRANPNEATVVIGHSLGAAAAIETAKQLGKQGVTVDLVITIDPVFSNKTVSSNVTEAQNYYETRDPNPVIRGKMLTAESPNTALSNTEVLGVNRHTDIDDVVADTGAAATQVREVGMRYVSAPTCGDPNFVGPCAR